LINNKLSPRLASNPVHGKTEGYENVTGTKTKTKTAEEIKIDLRRL